MWDIPELRAPASIFCKQLKLMRKVVVSPPSDVGDRVFSNHGFQLKIVDGTFCQGAH